MESLTAYLDTCVVSGLAKSDLPKDDLRALRRILEARKRGQVEVVTSPVTKKEINQIPDHHRSSHEILYNLLQDVPEAKTHRTSGLSLVGVGGGPRQDPLLTALKGVLPDPSDAEHVFQATRNDVQYFITTDVRTLVRHTEAIQSLCGIKIVTPVQFKQLLDVTPTTRRDG